MYTIHFCGPRTGGAHPLSSCSRSGHVALSGLVRLPGLLSVWSLAGDSRLLSCQGPTYLSPLMAPGFLCTSCSLVALFELYYICHVVAVMRVKEEMEGLGLRPRTPSLGPSSKPPLASQDQILRLETSDRTSSPSPEPAELGLHAPARRASDLCVDTARVRRPPFPEAARIVFRQFCSGLLLPTKFCF